MDVPFGVLNDQPTEGGPGATRDEQHDELMNLAGQMALELQIIAKILDLRTADGS
jgi:hypothetical protein